MADQLYVSIEGAKQGPFAGESLRERRTGQIEGTGFHYGVSSAHEVGSGLATGRRTHQPVTFVKQWGAATPQLFAALTTNEVLRTVLFEFVRSGDDGEETVTATVRLSNAVVTAIELSLEEDAGLDTHPLEQVSLGFQRIEITHPASGNTALDDRRR